MTRWRWKRSLPLIGLLIFAFTLAGCFGTGAGFGPTGPGAKSGSPDVNAPSPGIPATDDGLFAHVPGEVLVKVASRANLEQLAEELGASLDDINYLEPVGWGRLHLPRFDESLTDVLRQLDADPRVQAVQANHTEYVLPYVSTPELERRLRIGAMAVSDPYYGTHQYGPQTIHAPAAWHQGVTGKNTWVAIIDTGVDPSHPDLAAKLIPGLNPDQPNAGTADFHGHGTHVAGSAAALTDNELGVAGVAPDAGIMPVRVFNPVGGQVRATDFAIAVGIIVAGNPSLIGHEDLSPAAAANLSLGGPVYSQLILDAVNYASDRGVAVVASMGNSTNQEVSYPAAYPRVIAVGATDAHDHLASFSTTGPHNSVAAPGVNIYSTIPGGGYEWMSGTSMAAPHVTGAVALLREKYPHIASHLVKELLEDTADGSGFTRAMGHGRINVARALLKGDGFETKYGILEVYVHNGRGGDGMGNAGILEADVVLWRGGEVLRSVRTGGLWEDPNMLFDGMAWFYELAPGDDYGLTVRLDPDNGWHAVTEETLVVVENLRIEAGQVTHVSVPMDLSGGVLLPSAVH